LSIRHFVALDILSISTALGAAVINYAALVAAFVICTTLVAALVICTVLILGAIFICIYVPLFGTPFLAKLQFTII